MSAKFWIGAQGDAELEPEHIGRIVMLEVFSPSHGKRTDSRDYVLNVHVGELAGYTEIRGRGTYRMSEIGYQSDGVIEYPDLSVHEAFSLRVIFTDGRAIDVHEEAFASVWLAPTKEES